MATDQVRFDDGAAYERYMGAWSQLAGSTILDWLAPRVAQFCRGDAMTQPFPDDTVDAAVMPLVIFSLSDPAKGVCEMARVPPNPGASRLDAMRELWTGAGLDAVETREINVQRTFADFDDYWTTILGGPSVRPQLAVMASGDIALFMSRMRAILRADAAGRSTVNGRANAVKGRVPGDG